jgi:hypothetical protein
MDIERVKNSKVVQCYKCQSDMFRRYCPCLCGDEWYECPICGTISKVKETK